MSTRSEALARMRSYVGKARAAYPWLKGRPKLGDCAAGYSYTATGKVQKIIWVHELVDLMKKNGTWRKGKPQPGDAVIYDWNGDGGCDHVAMFHSVNKAGLWVAYGANQGKPHTVSKLQTGKGVILGWGTPFKYEVPPAPVAVPPVVDAEPAHTETDMPLDPSQYPPKAEVAPEAPVTVVEAPKPVVAPTVWVDLKKGSKGSQVKTAQTALKITADGDFGPITEKAVKAFQVKKGIIVTGIINEETWKRLVK